MAVSPTPAFCSWAAAALIRQLRSGSIGPRVEAPDFVWEPMLSAIREAVGPADRDLVLRLLADHDTRMLGGLLSRGLPHDATITEALRLMFQRETNGERQLGLFHQVVARAVDSDLAASLSDWAEVNADQLIAEQEAFFSGPEARERLDHRMSAPDFRHKRWVYLYAAHALADAASVRAFVEPYLDDPDPLMARAARVSFSRLPS